MAQSFEERKEANSKRPRIRNEDLYAGSPMYYYCRLCRLCGEEMILSEDHLCMAPWFCNNCVREGRALGPNQPLLSERK